MDRTKLCYYPKSMKTKHWQLINIIFNFHSLTKNICVTWINNLTKSIENPKVQNSNVLCNPNYGFQSLDFTKNITVLYVFLILSFDKNVGIGQKNFQRKVKLDVTFHLIVIWRKILLDCKNVEIIEKSDFT